MIIGIMARRVVSKKRNASRRATRAKSRFKLPQGWTVYTKKHAGDNKAKLLDVVLYKHKNNIPLGKVELHVLDELAKYDMTYKREYDTYGVRHVFECNKLPQSLNDRDNSRWFMKKQYQAIWDGLVLKMTEQSTVSLPLIGPFVLFYQPYRKRYLDMDNSASGVKSIIDAMVHMGVLVDDNEKVIYDYKPCRPVKDKTDRIVITLVPVEYGSKCTHLIVMPSGRTVKF